MPCWLAALRVMRAFTSYASRVRRVANNQQGSVLSAISEQRTAMKQLHPDACPTMMALWLRPRWEITDRKSSTSSLKSYCSLPLGLSLKLLAALVNSDDLIVLR